MASKYTSLLRRASIASSSTQSNGEVQYTEMPMNVEGGDPEILHASSMEERAYQDSVFLSMSSVIDTATASLQDLSSTASSSVLLQLPSGSSISLPNPRDKQIITKDELAVMTTVFDKHFPTRERIKWRKFHAEWIKEATRQKGEDNFLELYNRTEKVLEEKVKYMKKNGNRI